MGRKLQLPREPIYLGRLLDEKRLELGLTLKKLSKQTGVDVGQLSRFCSGDFKTLSTNLQIVLECLQINWRPLIDEQTRSVERVEQATGAVPLQLLKDIESGWERAGSRREAFEQALIALAKVFG